MNDFSGDQTRLEMDRVEIATRALIRMCQFLAAAPIDTLKPYLKTPGAWLNDICAVLADGKPEEEYHLTASAEGEPPISRSRLRTYEDRRYLVSEAANALVVSLKNKEATITLVGLDPGATLNQVIKDMKKGLEKVQMGNGEDGPSGGGGNFRGR